MSCDSLLSQLKAIHKQRIQISQFSHEHHMTHSIA